MPKPKRYNNLRNSFCSLSSSQGLVHSSSTTESEPSCFDDTSFCHQQLNQNLRQRQLPLFLQPTSSIQAAPHPTPSVQTTMQLISSAQTVSQHKSSKNPSGRESMRHWTVDAIDSQGAIKKLKLKKRDLFNLSRGDRIVVVFDDVDSPIGEGQGILAGFCGILAKDCTMFPIHFEKWSDLPAAYFNRCFDQFITPRFYFRTTESNARRYVYNSMCRKWGARRIKLFDKAYDPLKSRAEIMDKVPVGIPRDQWISYVDYRFKDETKEKIELAMTQSTIDESEISTYDGVGKVLGKEHSGRVRCLGLGVVPSRAFKQTRLRYSNLSDPSYNNGPCSSQCQEKYNQMLKANNQSQDNYNVMMNAHNQLMNAFKTYMIMKEGAVPEQFVGIFTSTTQFNAK